LELHRNTEEESCQGSQHAWGITSHASALTRELGAMSVRARLLQTHPYKRHFYRQENDLNTGGTHRAEAGGPESPWQVQQ